MITFSTINLVVTATLIHVIQVGEQDSNWGLTRTNLGVIDIIAED
jgi:hypothetical protein